MFIKQEGSCWKSCKKHPREINEARMQWMEEWVGGMKTKTGYTALAKSLAVQKRWGWLLECDIVGRGWLSLFRRWEVLVVHFKLFRGRILLSRSSWTYSTCNIVWFLERWQMVGWEIWGGWGWKGQKPEIPAVENRRQSDVCNTSSSLGSTES